MTTIDCTTDKGLRRHLTVTVYGAGGTEVHLHTPETGAGPRTRVDTEMLRNAVASRLGTTLLSLPGFPDRPLEVQPCGSQIYLWIHNYGDNGWSIYADAARLANALSLPDVPGRAT